MKKGCTIAGVIGLILISIVGGVFFLLFRLIGPMTEDGEKFLAAVASGPVGTAYGMTSAALRSGQTEKDFAETVKTFGLDGFESASWSNRRIVNDRGVLEGTVRTKAGGSVPLTIEMIKEGDAWKVLSIRGPKTGASSGAIIEKESSAAVPGPDESARLALEALLSFNEAVQTKSFAKFHGGISRVWREQITPAKLLEIFQPFIDAEIDIAPIKALSPVFKSPPAVNADGLLVLEGHYPTTPKKVYFTLKFIDGSRAWKLGGVNVNVAD